jgi:hypothetical protein
MRPVEGFFVACSLGFLWLIALVVWRCNDAHQQVARAERDNRVPRRRVAAVNVIPIHRPAYSVGGVLDAALRESVLRQCADADRYRFQ